MVFRSAGRRLRDVPNGWCFTYSRPPFGRDPLRAEISATSLTTRAGEHAPGAGSLWRVDAPRVCTIFQPAAGAAEKATVPKRIWR